MDVTIVTVNFKTPSLLKACVSSVLAHYPNIPYILVDNGGCKESKSTVKGYDRLPNFTTILNDKNKYHGGGMNQGVRIAETRYVFTLDTDTKVLKPGFLEAMQKRFEEDELLFALGWLRYTNAQGVASPKQELKRGMKYIHPYACMLDRKKFLRLPARFLAAGAPSTRVMAAANKKGYHLESFPIEKYIWHQIAGTRGRFGGRYLVPTDTPLTKWRKHRI